MEQHSELPTQQELVNQTNVRQQHAESYIRNLKIQFYTDQQLKQISKRIDKLPKCPIKHYAQVHIKQRSQKIRSFNYQKQREMRIQQKKLFYSAITVLATVIGGLFNFLVAALVLFCVIFEPSRVVRPQGAQVITFQPSHRQYYSGATLIGIVSFGGLAFIGLIVMLIGCAWSHYSHSQRKIQD